MTPTRLKKIRDDWRKYPGAWSTFGHHLMKPQEIRYHGPIAIQQRGELLEYIDELRRRLNLREDEI